MSPLSYTPSLYVLKKQIIYFRFLKNIYLSIWLCQVSAAARGLTRTGSRACALSNCGMQDLSSLTRDRTCVPCIGRQILNHWTPREIPVLVVVNFIVYIMLHVMFQDLFFVLAARTSYAARGHPALCIAAVHSFWLLIRHCVNTVQFIYPSACQRAFLGLFLIAKAFLPSVRYHDKHQAYIISLKPQSYKIGFFTSIFLQKTKAPRH